MNWSILFAECIIEMLVFGVLTFGLLLINPLTFISDYPPEIQERYYLSRHREAAKKKLSKIMIVKKLVALAAFALIFAWMAHLTGAEDFLSILGVVYIHILVIAAFDTFFLDWVLFANIKKIRLPGTEDMDKEYHQKWFHVKVLLPMLPVFAIGGVLIALLTMAIW